MEYGGKNAVVIFFLLRRIIFTFFYAFACCQKSTVIFTIKIALIKIFAKKKKKNYRVKVINFQRMRLYKCALRRTQKSGDEVINSRIIRARKINGNSSDVSMAKRLTCDKHYNRRALGI